MLFLNVFCFIIERKERFIEGNMAFPSSLNLFPFSLYLMVGDVPKDRDDLHNIEGYQGALWLFYDDR